MKITTLMVHSEAYKGIYLLLCDDSKEIKLMPSIKKYKSAILIYLTFILLGIRYNKKKFGIAFGLPCLFFEIGVLNGKEENRNDYKEKETN